MVKPVVQRHRSTPLGPRPEAEFGETKTRILDAAFRRLVQQGYAALSMREIGRDAGVNHALFNYHFRSKDQLVIAVLDEANRRLLERQQRMYAAPGGFAEKWAQARRFYQSDLASGFVRLQAELWAASFADPGLREKFVLRIQAWRKVVADAVRDALATLEAEGMKLPAPFSRRSSPAGSRRSGSAWSSPTCSARRKSGPSTVPRWTRSRSCSSSSTPGSARARRAGGRNDTSGELRQGGGASSR